MRKFCSIGYPQTQSVSPEMHASLFKQKGITDCVYTKEEIHPDDLLKPETVAFLKGLNGFNITLPHKIRIMDICDEIDEVGQLYNATNTISNRDGKIVGTNTDIDGFFYNLRMNNVDAGENICIMGAGGVGRMYAIALGKEGKKITLAILPQDQELAEILSKEMVAKTGCQPPRIIDVRELNEGFDLLINATPCGMFPNVDGIPVMEEVIAKQKVVYDSIFNPYETKLIKTADKLGVKTVRGLDMLIGQAAYAHIQWGLGEYTNEQLAEVRKDLEIVLKERAEKASK